jgi:hypothetical protein
MRELTTYHHVKGILFFDRMKQRRYAVNIQGVMINNEITLDSEPDYYAELQPDDAEYFQLSLTMDDLDEVIYMSRTIKYGVTIMKFEVINNNPNNFRAMINGSLELHIHYEDGVKAMPGLPNIELLKEYWKNGVQQNAGENATEVERLLRYVEPVQKKVKGKRKG